MSNTQTEFRSLVRSKGYRLTPQRQMILEAVREAGGHCTPEQVYERVQTKSSAINRATVYRTLEFLLKLGLVTTAHLQENQVVYELASPHPHHHFVCQSCHHSQEIDHHLVVPFFQQIEAHMQVTVLTDHLVLFGLCPTCRHQPPVALP
jgi:Fur family transcriptional regulator, ferric uptake regulator